MLGFLELSRNQRQGAGVERMRRGNVSAMDGTDDDEAEIRKTSNRLASKRPSILSNMSGATDGKAANSGHIDLSRINVLKASVNKHNEILSKFLLTCKESAEKGPRSKLHSDSAKMRS